MNNKKPITVYWSPAQFVTEEESWNLLYQDPQSVSKKFYDMTYNKAESLKCPASRFVFRNIYSINSTIDENIVFDNNLLKEYYESKNINYPIELPVDSSVALSKVRPNQMKDHINLVYKMSWLFFAEEDLDITVSAPYFPSISPAKNALLATGSFNIGKWFRHITPEYFVPIEAKTFTYNRNDPIVFLQFHTERPIVFKKFLLTKTLSNLADEIVFSTSNYRTFRNLKERYDIFSQTKMRNTVLHEIKKNLIEE